MVEKLYVTYNQVRTFFECRSGYHAGRTTVDFMLNDLLRHMRNSTCRILQHPEDGWSLLLLLICQHYLWCAQVSKIY